MGLTFEECEKLHRELWNWLAETGSGEKSEWPGWNDDNRCDSNCPACEFGNQHSNDENDLCGGNCTIDWGGIHCLDKGSAFEKWGSAQTPKTRKKYAAIIRDMPWRKK